MQSPMPFSFVKKKCKIFYFHVNTLAKRDISKLSHPLKISAVDNKKKIICMRAFLDLILIGCLAIIFSDNFCFETISSAMKWVDHGKTQSRLGGLLMRCAGSYMNTVLLPRIKQIFSGNFQDEHFVSGHVPGSTPPRKLCDFIFIKKQ